MSDWPKYIGNGAQIASALVAAFALFFIWQQVTLITKSSEQTQRNAQVAHARQVYISYSQLTIQYPELSEPEYDKLKSSPIELVRYKNFVTHMLFAYDEILSTIHDAEWLASFQNDLLPHVKYLCEENAANFYEQFYPKMRTLLMEAKKDCPAGK